MFFSLYLYIRTNKVKRTKGLPNMLQFVAVLNVKESSVVYDSKIEHYRTPEINSVIGGVAQLSKGLGEIKKSDSQNLFEKSDLVPGTGLEPVHP